MKFRFYEFGFFFFLVFVRVSFLSVLFNTFHANNSLWCSAGPAGAEGLLQFHGTQPQHLLLKPHTGHTLKPHTPLSASTALTATRWALGEHSICPKH